MNRHTRFIAAWVAVLATAGVASAATVGFDIEPTSYLVVPPGGAVEYQITCTVSGGDNYGLATFGVDVLTDLDAAQEAALPTSAVASFVMNEGFTNPAGFGGTQGNADGGESDDDLLQVGGAQNTIGNTGSPYPDYPVGSVVLNVGQGGKLVVATGKLVVPLTASDGYYNVNLDNAFAGVITSNSGPPYPVEEVASPSTSSGFRIQVQSDRVELYRNQSLYSTYPTIQDAVNNVQAGDEIVLAPGVYYENVVFPQDHAAIDFVLRSQAPSDLAMAAETIVDGSRVDYSVITCHGEESSAAAIRGLTMTGGNAGGTGGGIQGRGSSITVENCYLINNVAGASGGGLGNLYGTVSNCVIAGNSTPRYGGGLCSVYGTTTGCIIGMNHAGSRGGGVYGLSAGPILNSVIMYNTSAGTGGGAWSLPSYVDSPEIRNCTFLANAAATDGGGLYMGRSLVRNCILRDNTVGTGVGAEICLITGFADSTVSYSNVEGGFTGIGNKRNPNGADLGNPIDYANNNNTDASPTFVATVNGMCTADAEYDPGTNQTIVHDDGLLAELHAVAGLALQDTAPPPGGPRKFQIVDSDYDTITVWGDARDYLTAGLTFTIADFHLAGTDTICKDAGDNTGIAGEQDVDGGQRIQNSTVDIGADEVPAP